MDNWKTVFKNPRYFALAIISATVFYLLNSLILNFTTIKTLYKTIGITKTISTFLFISANLQNNLLTHSLISLIITSILIGTLISFIAYKIRVVQGTNSKKTGFLASAGIFIAALAPGCAVCGIGLISALGLGSILITFLPYHGFEVSVLAILILIYANWKASKDLFICKKRLKTSFTKSFKYTKTSKK